MEAYIQTSASAAAGGAVQEVLLQAVAHASAELRARAADSASGTVAGIRVITLGITTHHSLALLVTTCALPGSALQIMAATLSIWRCLIIRARRRITRADFCGIARAGASSADSPIASELAAFAAPFIRIVAHGTGLELACRGFAAVVVPTALLTTAVALLARLDDAVAALLAADGLHLPVVRQAIRLDRVTADGAANVADRTRAEVSDPLAGGGIHDVLLTGIARTGAERAALLGIDNVGVGASFRRAVMDGSKSVACLMGDDLPLAGTLSPNDDVGTGYGLFATAGRLTITCHARVGRHGRVHTCLAQPGETDGGTCVAGAEQSPVTVVILLSASPG